MDDSEHDEDEVSEEDIEEISVNRLSSLKKQGIDIDNILPDTKRSRKG